MSIPRSLDRFLLLLALGGASLCVQAGTVDGERARIAREREQALQRYAQQEQVCRTQFVVTSCIEDAKAERRVALQRLAREQAVLDDQDRRARATARLKQLDEKRHAAAQRVAEGASEPRVVQRAAPAASSASSPRQGAAESRALDVPRISAPLNRETRKANAEAYEQRLRAAQAHRQAAEQRNRERAASGKASAPLTPPASAASH